MISVDPRGEGYPLKNQRRPKGRLSYPRTSAQKLSPRQRTVLEVILQNPCSQRRADGFSLALNHAHDFSATHDLGSRKACDLGWQYEIDFELRVGLQHIIGLKEHSRPADVLGFAHVPLRFAETAIT